MHISGRCYCGAHAFRAEKPPVAVAFCHCGDCKRWTGAPAPAFAAFERSALLHSPRLGEAKRTNPGVEHWNCSGCGSPLAAQFDYLPGQVYVPLGLIDQAGALQPSLECHVENRLGWLHSTATLKEVTGSARDTLNEAGT